MIRLTHKLPKSLYLATSGGVDSMAALDFLSRCHDVKLLHFNHGTADCIRAREFLLNYSQKNGLPLFVGEIADPVAPKGRSLEEHWRIERYRFLKSFDGTVVTAHHLDDCVETWLWSSIHGKSKLIPFTNKNIIRPFMTTPKLEFIKWCNHKNIPWVEDTTNSDVKFIRNYIRTYLMPSAMHVNPGLPKVIKKLLMQKLSLHGQH